MFILAQTLVAEHGDFGHLLINKVLGDELPMSLVNVPDKEVGFDMNETKLKFETRNVQKSYNRFVNRYFVNLNKKGLRKP